jgi:predicted P-loop ATPase
MTMLKNQFSILDHLESLTPAKEKGKYVCPVCGDDNLSINHRTGAYSCMSNECKSALIRDKIAPLTPEAKAQYRQQKTRPKSKKEKEQDSIESTIEIEMKCREIALQVEGKYESSASAMVKLGAWAKEHGHNVYSAQQLLKQYIKQLPQADEDDDYEKPRLLKDHQSIQAKFGDRLRYNTLFRHVEFDGAFLDPNDARLEFTIGHSWRGKSSREDVADIVYRLAKENSYSPVIEYLDRANQGSQNTAILDNLADRHFGTSNPIHQLLLIRFLVSAVARAYVPGCQCDTALILQGEQGYGKSTFFRTLASPDWFDDSLGSASDKDERLKLHRAWMIEWAELEAIFKRKDISAVKAFMTTKIDLIRPPYGRSIESFKRASVIVGTTNQQEFLNDTTGSRRFWVIPIQKPIDREQVEAERDRIWGAAVQIYRQGEPWWLTDEEEALINETREPFQMHDPWHDLIEEYLELRSEVSTAEILENVIKLPVDRYDRASTLRINGVMKRLGWVQHPYPVTRRGKRERVWKK